MNDLHPLTQAIIAGKRKEVPELVSQCLAAGEKAGDIVEKRLVPGMAIVGDKFKRNEIFVPEMLIAARAMKEALKILEPALVAAGVKPEHTAVIGTVEGDLHDIGKNLAGHTWAMLLKRPEVEIGAVLRALEAELVADDELRPLVDATAAAGEGQLASQPKNEARAVETEIKFAGYLEQQKKSIERLKAAEGVRIPEWLDYTVISGLSREMQEKLMRVRPGTIGQASRIPGVTPAALGLVHISIKVQGKGREGVGA